MIEFPAPVVEIPKAEFLGKAGGGHWVRACGICSRWFLRRNRYTLAGVVVCPECAQSHNDAYDARRSEYSDEHRYATNRAINMMQAHADVASPDAFDSPGALWLLSLYHSAVEAWENGEITPDADDPEDRISEMADSAVPIYTHNRWQIFTDLCADRSEVELHGSYTDEYGSLTSDAMTEMAGDTLQEIARNAFERFREEMTEELTCDECGEFPCECKEYGECLECGRDAVECYLATLSEGAEITGECVG